MKTKKNAGEEKMKKRIVLTIGLFLWCIPISAHALYVDVNPENPTTTDPISIYAWTWFGYAERYDLVNTTYSITGYDINMEVVMQDKGYGLTIPWAGGGIVQIGTLAEGYYTVTADMYMIPYGGSIPEYYDSGSTSFDVVPEPVVDAEIDIDPDTLNLASKGKYITCYIWLPEDYNVADVNSASVFLEDEVQADWLWFNEKQNVVMVKFSRSDVRDILVELGWLGDVELTVTGYLMDGSYFVGTDSIKVVDKGRLRGRRVNSNSKVVDGIEYYIQTDKAVYNLGENIEILYRITNLTDEEWRLVGFFPIMDMIVEAREGKNFNEIWHWSWDKIHPMGPIVFRLEPGESAELRGIWPQIDLHGSVEPEDHTHVPPGRYRISGVFYPTDSSIAVDITIVKRKS